MSPDSTLRYLVSLVFVLGLIGALAWVLRRFGARGPFRGAARRRLAVVEVMPLDARRRLVLLRRDGREHLLLLGPTRDLVIETGINPPIEPGAADFAAHLPEGRP